MITNSISKYTLITDQWKSNNSGLFDKRSQSNLSFFDKLLSANLKLYSQIIDNSSFPIDINEKLHIHFVKTTCIYSQEPISAIQDDTLMSYIKDIPSNTTHLLFLDIFSRVIKIKPLIKDLYLFPNLYGDNHLLRFRGLDLDKPISNIVLPIGNITNSPYLFHSDQLGFRYKLSPSHIFNNDNTSSVTNVAVVGGSFASSVYSLPGETFVELLEELLNIKGHTKNIRLFNLSQPGHMQSDSISVLINTTICKHINYVIWIDGLNDLCSSVPASSLDISSMPISFPSKFNGVSFDKNLINSITMNDRIESFIYTRRFSIDLLESIGVKSINILQPILDRNAPNHTNQATSLFPYMHDSGWKDSYINYIRIIPYLKSLSFSKYGLKFEIPKPSSEPFDFWDFAHLSPLGEQQFAKTLHPLLENSLNIN